MLKNLKQEQHFVLIFLKMPNQIKSSSEKLLKVTLSQRRCSEPAIKLLLTYLTPHVATSFPGFSPTRPLGRVGENPGNEVAHVDLCVEACVADRLRP